MATILVDFDGTCIPTLPMGGYTDYNTGAEKVLKQLIKNGHDIVLWTVRNNSDINPYNVVCKNFKGITSLEEAIDWFKKRNIPLFGINKVPGEENNVGIGRKVLGDFLIDDVAIGTPIKQVSIDYYSCLTNKKEKIDTYHVDWDKLLVMLEELGLV